MADLSEAQRKRAEARERRRQQSDSGNDGGESAPDKAADDERQPHQSVRQAAKVAAAVGAAGAAAAAARALTSHEPDQSDEAPEEPRDEADDDRPQHDEPQEDEPQEDELQEEDEGNEEQPVAGADAGNARRVIDRAREQLQDLLERPVESVSSLERTHNGWVLALEVIELNRIPESTDVLASYEMELDDNLDLRRYQQVRRYHRGRTDRAEGS